MLIFGVRIIENVPTDFIINFDNSVLDKPLPMFLCFVFYIVFLKETSNTKFCKYEIKIFDTLM